MQATPRHPYTILGDKWSHSLKAQIWRFLLWHLLCHFLKQLSWCLDAQFLAAHPWMRVRGCWCPGNQSDRTLPVIGRQAAQLLVLVNLDQLHNCKTLMGIWISQGHKGPFHVVHKFNIHVKTHCVLKKWQTLWTQYFQMPFLEWQSCILIKKADVCS